MESSSYANDNEELSFVTLAAATANVVRYLQIDEQKTESDDERGSRGDDEKRALEHLEFVTRRLRDLERFEDRARGRKRI
jgi:hypothetical protein